MIRCGAGPAEAPLASDNDNPAAAPSVGTVFLKRLRFDDGLTCGTEESLSLNGTSLAWSAAGFETSLLRCLICGSLSDTIGNRNAHLDQPWRMIGRPRQRPVSESAAPLSAALFLE
jgi:hypothetical protein